MPEESQDADVGRVMREHAAAAKQVAVLEAELIKIRDMYYRLARALHRDTFIRFDDEPDVGNPPDGFRKVEFRFSSDEIDGKRLKLLCKDLRDAWTKQADLDKQKRRLGI